MDAQVSAEFQVADIAAPEYQDDPATLPIEAETHEGTEHAGDAHGAKPGLPQLDTTTFASQLFWLLISFAVLYYVISRIAVPKIGGVLGDRAAKIKGDLDGAADAKRASEAAIAGYEKALTDAKTRALKLGDEVRSKVQSETNAKNDVAAKELAASMAKAEQRIAEMRSSAMARVGDVARQAAADIVAKLTGEPASASDLDSAISAAVKRQ